MTTGADDHHWRFVEEWATERSEERSLEDS